MKKNNYNNRNNGNILPKFIPINQNTKFKGKYIFFAYIQGSYASYTYRPYTTITVRRLFVRTEKTIFSMLKPNQYVRQLVTMDEVIPIYQEQLDNNDKTYIVLKPFRNGQAIISTNKQDIINFVKKYIYNNINLNPWRNVHYSLIEQYYNALHKLKCL